MSTADRILEQWGHTFHTPKLEVQMGEAVAIPAQVSVQLTLQGVSATASLTFAAYPESFAGLRTPITIRAGWGADTAPLFTGYSDTSEPRWYPQGYKIQASGILKQMQYQYPNEVLWFDATDTQIASDLVGLSGVDSQSIDGRGMVFGTTDGRGFVMLPAGQSTWSLLNRLDQITGYKTFDSPDGTVRRRQISGYPAEQYALLLQQGVNLFSFTRNRRYSDLHNKVIVQGYPQPSYTPMAIRGDPDPDDPNAAPHPWIPDPPRHIAFEFTDDLLETDEQCVLVAERLMQELNHVTEEATGRTPGNPYLVPGMTVGVQSDKAGIGEVVRYLVTGVTHSLDNSGFWTSVTLQGGIGATGEAGDLPGTEGGGLPTPPPSYSGIEAAFAIAITEESFMVEEGETATATRPTITISEEQYNDLLPEGDPRIITPQETITLYTIFCDAGATYGATVDPSTINYTWSASTGQTGSGSFFAFALTRAEIEAGATVTLTAQGGGESHSVTKPIAIEDAAQRMLFGYTPHHAIASMDGGALWMEWVAQQRIPEEEEATEVLRFQKTAVAGEGGRFYIDEWVSTSPPLTLSSGATVLADVLRQFSSGTVTFGLGTGQPWVDQKFTEGGVQRIITTNNGSEWIGSLVLSNPGGDGNTVRVESTYTGCCQADTDESGGCRWQHKIHNCAFVVKLYSPTYPDVGLTEFTAVAEIGGADFSLFGSSDGRLFRVGTYTLPGSDTPLWDTQSTYTDTSQSPHRTYPALGEYETVVDLEAVETWHNANAPATAVTREGFGAVTAIWINEASQDRATIGTATGQIYRGSTTLQSGTDLAAMGWRKLSVPGLAPYYQDGPEGEGLNTIHYLVESALHPGQYRIAMGDTVYITHDDFQNVTPLHAFAPAGAGEAVQVTLSGHGNFAIKTNPVLGVVLGEDGSLLPVEAGVLESDNALQGVTHHIRAPQVWAITADGVVVHTDTEESSTLTTIGQIDGAVYTISDQVNSGEPSAGEWAGVEALLRDGGNAGVLYAGAATGFFKSFDSGRTWRKLYDIPIPDDEEGVQWQTVAADTRQVTAGAAALFEESIMGVGYNSPEWEV